MNSSDYQQLSWYTDRDISLSINLLHWWQPIGYPIIHRRVWFWNRRCSFRSGWDHLATDCFYKQIIDTDTNMVVNYAERSICYILLMYTTRLFNQRSYVHNLYRLFEHFVYKTKPYLDGSEMVHCNAKLHFTIVSVPGTSNTLADALSRLCPNLTEIALPLRTTEFELLPTSPSSFTVSALTAIEPASDDQLEYNAFVGHNGVDRTLTRLFSLQQVWKNMKQHVRTFIQNCPVSKVEYNGS